MFSIRIFANLKDNFIQIVAVVCTNDEHPVSSAPLESMQLVFIGEDGRVCLKLLTFLRPIDEGFFVKALDCEVDGLVERACTECTS